MPSEVRRAAPYRFAGVLAALGLLLAPATAFADHGAPPPRLGGVTLCLEPSSVRLELEGVPLPELLADSVVRRVADAAKRTLTSTGVPVSTACEGDGYVLLELYARFLDPETYLGFPARSYTYVTTLQVGRKPEPGSVAETVLPGGRYANSASDIVQAPTVADLTTKLAALGGAQVRLLAATWRDLNVVSRSTYLVFAALGGSLILLRGVTAALGRLR